MMQAVNGGAVVPRAWICSSCGRVDSWGPGWVWLGSWREMDDGLGPRRVLCPACAPAEAKSYLDEEDCDA